MSGRLGSGHEGERPDDRSPIAADLAEEALPGRRPCPQLVAGAVEDLAGVAGPARDREPEGGQVALPVRVVLVRGSGAYNEQVDVAGSAQYSHFTGRLRRSAV